ncbi:hypothetical protein [Nocardioides sp. BYT-33-1]|uniref:hypothetical protein n=1 Tax=Nocardioides sp. BYT-33-1 TaxID=3416952 RepID=UPI003F52D2C8
MPRVTGPNGLSIPVSEDMAAALARHPEGEFVISEAPKPPEKAPAKKAAPKPPEK